MSKLYISDLEKIVNGKIERYSLGSNGRSLLSLDRIDKVRHETRCIRETIIREFKNDIKEKFDRIKGSRIEADVNVQVDNEQLFSNDYLDIIIPTILGDTRCLLSNDGIISSTSKTTDLDEKVEIIMPYVKRLFELKSNSHILDNEFFQDVNIFNLKDKVLILNGAGVFLPFLEYKDLTRDKLQELLTYYYSNYNQILKNILIYNSDKLERFKTDISFEKALKIYKGQ